LDNYVDLFQRTDFAEALLNTVIITAVTVILLVLLVPMAAYGIERIGGRAGRVLYVLFIAGLMIPFQVRMIPLVEGFNNVGLYSTLTSVILVHLGGAASFGVLLYSSFLKNVPTEVEEAAEVDGAGRLRTFWLIVFPMLMPVTSAFVIIQALNLWNDFFVPLVLLDSSSAGTINVAINRMVGLLTSEWQLIYTGAILAIIPSVVIFASFQRYFINGLPSLFVAPATRTLLGRQLSCALRVGHLPDHVVLDLQPACNGTVVRVRDAGGMATHTAVDRLVLTVAGMRRPGVRRASGRKYR